METKIIQEESKAKEISKLERKKKTIYVENLHENVTESYLVKPFGLRTTNCLIDNCCIEMSNLEQNGKHNGHGFISAPCHVCHELVKLHGLEFHDRKIIIEEAKTPPRTLVNELLTSAVANDQQSIHKI